jgi:hypothetical protein
VSTLLRPGIIPDQPWASRRLVPGVLPGFIVLALWASSWLLGWLRHQGVGTGLRVGAVAIIAAALVLPAVKTSWGISAHPLGANGLATKATSTGEVPAMNGLCAQIPRDASVVFVSYELYRNVGQDVRGMCNVPTAASLQSDPASVKMLVADIQRAGRRPVILATTERLVAKYGVPAKRVMDLHTTVDPHSLVWAPVDTDKIKVVIWMSEFSR